MNETFDKHNFTKVLNQNKGIVHKVAIIYTSNQADKEDLYQEICLQLWRTYGRYRGESKISTWIYRVALNTAISTLRKNNKSITTEELVPEKHYMVKNPEKDVTTASLFRAISNLGKVDRAIILLWLEEKSYDEISDIMGMTRSAVSVRIVRIKKKLEETIKKNEKWIT